MSHTVVLTHSEKIGGFCHAQPVVFSGSLGGKEKSLSVTSHVSYEVFEMGNKAVSEPINTEHFLVRVCASVLM